MSEIPEGPVTTSDQVSPFKFYIDNGKLVREVVYGSRKGEKAIFRDLAEICEYLKRADNDLWLNRGIASHLGIQLEQMKMLAGQTHSA